MSDFKLSAQLLGHESDIRAVVFPAPGFVITSSRDCTVRVWKAKEGSPPMYEPHVAFRGSEYVNSAAYLPPRDENPDGLVLSAGKEMLIDVRPPTARLEDDAYRILPGHAHNVCTIDVAPSGKWFVSGGWDGQARVWSARSWETDIVLDGHGGLSVWAVLTLDDSTVVTGCADKKIRVFDLKRVKAGSADPVATFQAADIVRALCKLPDNHPTGAKVASAGNDGIVVLWSADGIPMASLHGHSSFVYSLAVLPTSEIVSCGEDRTARVWKGTECVQTITLPAISIWAVSACPKSGDFVVGSSDGTARVFSRDPKRQADAQTIKEFEEAVQSSSIPQEQLGSVNKEKLPGPEFLTSRAGTKEGQVQMIREDNGSVTAHTWSTSQQQWINVGTVVSSAASTGKKVEYQGKKYDYVFDVAIEEGQPSLKLPYNLSENPYERAQKFINDNELSPNYLDQVANFISTNTQGATIGQSQSAEGPDPMGTESRYKPGEAASSSSSSRSLPVTSYTEFKDANLDMMFRKIDTDNNKFKECGRKDLSLSPSEFSRLASLHENLLEDKPVDDEFALKLLLRCLGGWPYADRRALMDLLRCLARSGPVASYENDDGTIVNIAVARAMGDAGGKLDLGVVMGALRVVANIFKTDEGRRVAAKVVSSVAKALEDTQELCASFVAGSPKEVALKRSLLQALAGVALNYAVMLHKEHKKSGVDQEMARRLSEVLKKVISQEDNPLVLVPAMEALGSLVASDKSVVSRVREIIHSAVNRAMGNNEVRSVGNQVLGLLP